MFFIVLIALPCFGAFTRSIDDRKTYKNAYRWTGKPRDYILDWAQETEDRLTGASAIEFSSYTPTDTEPGTTAGMLYYDDSENKFKYYNDSNWIAIESGSTGNSLDGAYDVGRSINVDGGTVTLTATNAADNVILTLVQSDTGTTKGVVITNAGTGNTIDIQGQSSSNDIEGTNDSWAISSIGTFTGVVGTWTGDQTWTGSVANVVFDATDDELLIEDDAVLSFGDVADVTLTWNQTNLLIEAATDNVGQIQLGATNSMDLKILGSTTSDIALFDASEGKLILDSYPIALGDGDAILLGDTLGTGDFSIAATSAVLKYTQVSADTGEITYGASGTDIPIKWFSETTANWVYFNVDEVEFEDVVIQMMDATAIEFGDGDDFTIHSTAAKKLQFTPATTDDDHEVLMGSDQSGVDLKLFGATTGEYWLFDASADSLLPVLGNYFFTANDAEADQFKVLAAGTVAGVAINFVTTDGKVLINADGGTWGDIELNSADDIILTTAGKLTITNASEAMTVSGALTVAGVTTLNGTLVGDAATTIIGFVDVIVAKATTTPTSVTAANSGGIYVNEGIAASPADSIFTLPTAAAGLTYTFVDANATSADDMWITANTGDTINGGTANKSFKNTGDVIGASVTIFAIDATRWIAVPGSIGTWANDNN